MTQSPTEHSESRAASPVLSVVVPTRNGSSRLERLVQALELQVDPPNFELVVVDDGSTDDTWEVLERLASCSAIEIRPLRADRNRGPASARNLGWRAARGWAIAFTDDDCIPQPRWLSALFRRLETYDCVQGYTSPDPRAGPYRGVFSHTVVVGGEWGFYETCNIAYRREVLEKVGGFDETFDEGRSGGRAQFGDDTDLAWRAKEAGAQTSFEPEAVVWHDVQEGTLWKRLRELPRKEGIVRAVRRHPGVRGSFAGGRWFAYPSHPRAIAVVVGLVWLGLRFGPLEVWVLSVVLALPWTRHRGMVVPKRHWLWQLPQALIFDLCEIAVFARASIRYRTLIL